MVLNGFGSATGSVADVFRIFSDSIQTKATRAPLKVSLHATKRIVTLCSHEGVIVRNHTRP